MINWWAKPEAWINDRHLDGIYKRRENWRQAIARIKWQGILNRLGEK